MGRQPSTVEVEAIYRTESRAVLATLIRLLGDFDRAEDALHDAFAAALAQWPRDGVPANPRAWLISAGRFQSIDALRRKVLHDKSVAELLHRLEGQADPVEWQGRTIDDDQLRLIFICCHPALPSDAQTALALREICGLTTEQIARAFLARPTAIAKRIVRAKAKIHDARIPYEVPSGPELPERLANVLQVIYLIFNEGYAATSGETLTRPDLSREAIYLGRMLLRILPEPEVQGLLALMLLSESRRPARTSSTGDVIVLEEQDRTLWDRALIAEGAQLTKAALASRRFGTYTVQAAIAAAHAGARQAAATDWAEIAGWYDLLYRISPTPVVELNRAVAVAMRDGPHAGLEQIDAILARGDLQDYYLAHAARADLLRRSGDTGRAGAAYRDALALELPAPSRRYLQRRLDELSHALDGSSPTCPTDWK